MRMGGIMAILNEPLSTTEIIINKDGSPTQYFKRYLERLAGAGVKSTSITGQVTSVNGQIGDVIIDIPDTGADFVFNIGTTIKSEISALIDQKIEDHNEDPESHPLLSSERSIFYSSHETNGIPCKSWYAPHFYQKGFSYPSSWTKQSSLSLSAGNPMGLTDVTLNNGASPGDFGNNRNVYVSAFYVPYKKARVKGVILPIEGGTTSDCGGDPDNCYAHKAAIFASKAAKVGGGRGVKSGLRGASASYVTVGRTSGSTEATIVFSQSAEYLAIAPEVGDIVSTTIVSGGVYDIQSGVITAVDDGTYTITIETDLSGSTGSSTRSQCFVHYPDDGYNSRWLGNIVWSSTGFTDFSTNQEDGWILSVGYGENESQYQSQLVGGERGASLITDFELSEGVYFLVLVEAAIGTPPSAVPKAVSSPIVATGGERTNGAASYYGQTGPTCRGLISSHLTRFDGVGNFSTIPVASMVNADNTQPITNVNFFCALRTTDADTVAALDSLNVDLVFPDIPFTADNKQLEAFTPAVGDGYTCTTDRSYLMPFVFPLWLFMEFVE